MFAVLKEGLSLTNDIRSKSLPNKLAKLEREYNEEKAKGCTSLPSNSPESKVLTTEITASAPNIPIDVSKAFFPLRKNPETGNIVPSYQTRVCVKKFLICQWQKKTLYFEDLSWFEANNYGLKKEENPFR